MAKDPRKAVFNLEAGFSEARKRLKKEFENGRRLAEEFGFSISTAYSLLDESVPDATFQGRTQLKVIGDVGADLYDAIAKIVGIGDQSEIVNYSGVYRYFRNNVAGHPVQGHLNILNERGRWRFRHYNNYEGSLKNISRAVPDHEGEVFTWSDKLYLLGVGKRYIRPIVIRQVDDLSRDRMIGVVIAINRGSAIFSAVSVMIHQSNSEFRKPKMKEYADFIHKCNLNAGVLNLDPR